TPPVAGKAPGVAAAAARRGVAAAAGSTGARSADTWRALPRLRTAEVEALAARRRSAEPARLQLRGTRSGVRPAAGTVSTRWWHMVGASGARPP
ncbi:unnamed protein product, partial [Urochloa humidicola]